MNTEKSIIIVQLIILAGTLLLPYLNKRLNQSANDAKRQVDEAIAGKTKVETLNILGHIVGDQAKQIHALNDEITALKSQVSKLQDNKIWLARARYIIRSMRDQIHANDLPLSVNIPEYLTTTTKEAENGQAI